MATQEPFPYKREFIDPQELWDNACKLDLSPLKVLTDDGINVRRKPGWFTVTKTARWEFNGKIYGVVSSTAAYDKIDKLVDYFSEKARVLAYRADINIPSPFKYYQSNYEQVHAAATRMQQKSPTLPFRHLLREALYSLCPECNSFKISVTKTILLYFKSKRVLDPSAGWGDRLLGAAASQVDQYDGVDPNPHLTPCFEEMLDFVKKPNFKFHSESFLTIDLPANYYDTVFTSPPFFDKEVYTSVDDPTQSIYQNTTVNSWLENFLYPYLRKAWECLKSGGYFVLHISQFKGAYYIDEIRKYMKSLRANYKGVIAMTHQDLSRAFPIWVWGK